SSAKHAMRGRARLNRPSRKPGVARCGKRGLATRGLPPHIANGNWLASHRYMMEMPHTAQPSGRPIKPAGPADRNTVFERAVRHSRRVRVLKFGLPVAAVALACFFTGLAYIRLPAGVSI